MDVRDFYESIGGDYVSVLGRLMNDRIITKFVLKFPADPTVGELKAAMDAEDWETAFRAAHTLKGVAMNLSFAKLTASAVVLTDALRPQNADQRDAAKLHEYFNAVQADYDAVLTAIARFGA